MEITEIKLTRAQRDLLHSLQAAHQRGVESLKKYCMVGYRPAQRLIDTGLVTFTPRAFSRWELHLTEEGKTFK